MRTNCDEEMGGWLCVSTGGRWKDVRPVRQAYWITSDTVTD